MKKFIFYSFLIIFELSHVLSIIVLPIEVKTKLKDDMEEPDEYYLYTKLNIGEPSQKIDCEINFEINDYFMTNYPSNVLPKYNFSLSNSFEKTTLIVPTSKYSGYLGYENFYFYNDIECKNLQKFEHINIAFPSFDNKLYACEIGLQSRHSSKKLISFIDELKTNKVINSYLWSLKLKNLNEGLIIIGAAPHEYDNNFKESELKLINSFSENSKPNWCLYFKFNSANETYSLSQNIKVLISPKILGFIANYYYLQAVEENFFKKYYDNKICERKIISFERRNYFKILCSKENFTNADIESYPQLNLFNIAFNYSFILEGKELFLEKEDKYELIILTEIGSSRTEWKLGRIFLKKYQIIFDDDNGLIGFYKSNYIKKEEQKEGISNFLKIGFLIIISAFFIFLSFIIYKKVNVMVKRKKLANELEDDFMYVSKIKNQKSINI